MMPYLTQIYIAARDQLRSPAILVARSIFLCLMVLVFNQLWIVLKSTNNTSIQIEPTNFLWYLVIAVTLQFSRPEGLHRQIEDDVKTGNIAYQLIRPIHFIFICFCHSFGTFLVRIPILLCIGGLLIYLVNGYTVPPYISHLPIIFALMLLSACFISLCTVFIGLSILFIYDSLPLFWLFQKCEYVLGGVFFPIIFYPEFLYKLCLATPFGWSIFGVARLIYDYSPQNAVETFWHLLMWNGIMLGVIFVIWNKLKKRICVYG